MGEKTERELIGKRIASARKAREMTQAELAKGAGAHFQTISKWERGVLTPSAPQLAALCKTLGVTADYLLGLTEEEPWD